MNKRAVLLTIVLFLCVAFALPTINNQTQSDVSTVTEDLGVNQAFPLSDTETLVPTSDVSTSGFVPSSGSDHYAMVDEGSTPDDATTYLDGEWSTDCDDRLGVGDMVATPSSITSVTGYFRIKRAGAAQPTYIRYGIMSGGTWSYNTWGYMGDKNWNTKSKTWTTDPNTASAWTEAGVNALQARVIIDMGSSWIFWTQVYFDVVYSVNNAPVNDQTPSTSNLDDTDNMYAKYKKYQITSYVSDGDGYADIDYLELGLWDNTRTTEYVTVRYDEDTNTFTQQDALGYASLDTGSSSATESGNDIDATFYITVDWDFPDATDLDAKCYVTDDEPATDTDWYEINYDVETRLDYTTFSITDVYGTADRGPISESGVAEALGTVIYYGSSDNHPPTTEVDVWVLCSDVAGSPWEGTDYEATGGTFSVYVDSDDVVGQDTYTFKTVQESAGSGGTDENHATHTDTYIADRVQVQSYSVTDSRVNINDNVNVDVTLWYDYDNSLLTDGGVTINSLAASHQGSGVWRITVSKSSVQAVTYNSVDADSNNAHGVYSNEDQNGQSITVIWDRIQVSSYAVSDSRDDINDNVNIDPTIIYDYDNAAVTDGTVTINGYSASHLGGGVWRITRTSASVTAVTYNNVQCTGNTHGITEEDQNGQSTTVIWDRLVFVLQADDTTPLAGIDVTISISGNVIYDYDDTVCTTYTFQIKYDSTDWTTFTNADQSEVYSGQAKGTNRIFDGSSTGVGCSETTYDITEFVSTSVSVTWQNNAIVIDIGAVLTNPSDSSYMYARYTTYLVTFNVSDPDGHADVSWVKLSLYSDDRGTEYWRLKVTWDGSSGTWSEDADASNRVELISGSCEIAGASNDLDGTFALKVEWAQVAFSNLDFYLKAEDDSAENTDDWAEETYDVETRLTLSGYNIQDEAGDSSSYWYRGNIDATVYGIGTIVFTGTSTKPVEVDVWISCSDVSGSPWSDTALDGSGNFRVTAAADDAVGQDTYSVVCVSDGEGAGGTDLIDSGTQTDTFIADRWDVQSVYVTPGNHIGVWEWGTINLVIKYDYDNTYNELGWDSVTCWRDEAQSQYVSLAGSPYVVYLQTQMTEVTKHNYTVRSVAGGVFGITEFTVTDSPVFDWIVWDEIREEVIMCQSVPPERNPLGTSLWVQLQFSYQHADYGYVTAWDDTPALRGPDGSTYVELNSYQGDGWWRGTFSSDVAVAWDIDSDYTQGGTVGTIDLRGDVNLHNATTWESVTLTLIPNLDWTIIGYNITIGYSGVYTTDSSAWSDTATLTNAYPVCNTVQSVDIDSSWVVSITETVYGLNPSDFVVPATETVIWDDIVLSSISYYWVQYSVDAVWLIMDPSTFSWDYNDSAVANLPNCKIQTYMNETSDDWAIISGGTCGTFSVGEFDTSWYWVNVTLNAEITVAGQSYDWGIWTVTLEVDILHSIHIEDSVIYMTDNYVTFGIHSNYGNACLTVWDNVTGTPDEVWYQNSEGWFQVPKSSTIGTHVMIVLINGSHSGSDSTSQAADGSDGDDWKYLTFNYTVSSAVLAILIEDWTPLTVTIRMTGTTNAAFNYYVYREGVYNEETGSITDTTSFSFTFSRNTTAGSNTYQIYFNSSTASGSRWKNITDDVSATYSWQYIYVFDTGDPATYLPWESFDFYVNDTLIQKNEFYDRTDQGYEIVAKDKFGDTIYNQSHSFARTYRLTIALYSFKVKLWVDGEVEVTITSSGGGTMETVMGWGDLEEFYFYGSKTYQAKWYLDDTDKKVKATGWHYYPATDWDGNQVNPDPNWYTPASADYLEIDDYGIGKLVSDVGEIDDGGGGGDTNTTAVAQAVVEGLAPGLGLGFAIVFLGLAILVIAVRKIRSEAQIVVVEPEITGEEDVSRARPRNYSGRSQPRGSRGRY